MQLIIILLITVSILTLMSGLVTFFGAKKNNKIRSAWFFAAAIFATAWIASILIFLTATVDEGPILDWHAKWTFISAIFIDISFLGYLSWNEKYGKILTYIFFVFGGIVSLFVLLEPELMYKDIVLAAQGNRVILEYGPLFVAYSAFFATIVPAIIVFLVKQFMKTRSTMKKNGDLVIMASFAISSTIVLIVNLILPLLNNWQYIWLGPLSLSITIIAFYYTILRYRSLNLSSTWLKIFSYIIIISSVAIMYMVIFSLIFAALFRGATPSIEVIILNFIMIVIFILLTPAMAQVTKMIRQVISEQTSEQKRGH